MLDAIVGEWKVLRKNRDEGRSRRIMQENAIRSSLYVEVPL